MAVGRTLVAVLSHGTASTEVGYARAHLLAR